MFDEFWSKYPNKQGDKKKARRLFEKHPPELQRRIIDDVSTRYTGIEKCFVPYPTTYLNGERWENDPIPRRENPVDWDTLAKQHARPGETMNDFKQRWSRSR